MPKALPIKCLFIIKFAQRGCGKKQIKGAAHITSVSYNVSLESLTNQGGQKPMREQLL